MVVALLIILFIKHNINNPSFWFDESGQFWIAKGLNHYSPPLSAVNGLSEVIRNNIKFNQDPGGFSIILHYWSSISLNWIFLRLLPLSFFFSGMLVMSVISIRWLQKDRFAYMGGLLLFTSPLLCQYAFELRPYSMEMLAALFGLFLIYYEDFIFSNGLTSIGFGIIASIIASSRYSSNIPILLSLVIILIFLLFKKNKKKLLRYILLILPIIITSGLIYKFVYIHQNPNGTPPAYVRSLMFISGTFPKSLLSTDVFYVLTPFLLLTLLFFASVRLKRLRSLIKPYRKYYLFTILVNLIFIALSFMGKYPWCPWGQDLRWGISAHTLLFISWVPIIFIIYSALSSNVIDVKAKVGKTILIFLFVFFASINAYSFQYSKYDTTYYNLKTINLDLNPKILINAGASPTIRYQFEYGPFKKYKNKQVYLGINTFNHQEYKSYNSITDFSNLSKYDYVLLSHFDTETSPIKEQLTQKNGWNEITWFGPSRLFKNIHVH